MPQDIPEGKNSKDSLRPTHENIDDREPDQTVADESKAERVKLADLREGEMRFQMVFEAAPIGFRGLARDVTEHLTAEKEKERMAAQIQQAQKMEAIGTLAG